MAFTKLNSFSKKPADLPDVPSPSLTPDDIRSYWQTPLDELLDAQSDLSDELNANGWVDNSKLAPKAVGVDNLSDEILNQPTTTTEVQAKLAQHDSQLAETSDSVGKSIEDYPIITPEVNDTARIQRALNDGVKNLFFAVNKDYTISDTLLWDVAKTSLIAYGVKIIADINDTTKYAIKTISSETANPYNQATTTVHGLKLIAKTTGNCKGILFDGNTNAVTNPNKGASHINFIACKISGFYDNLTYGQNAYSINFFGGDIDSATNNAIFCPSGFTNYGERMAFFGVNVYNNVKSVVNQNPNGVFYFECCSIDYSTQRIAEATGGGIIKFNDCHIESDSKAFDSTKRPFYVDGVDSLIEINGGYFLFTDAGNTTMDYIFQAMAAVGNRGGLFVDGAWVYGLKTTTKMMATGSGNVRLRNLKTKNDDNIAPIISRENNLVVDGLFNNSPIQDEIFITGDTASITSKTQTGTNVSLSLSGTNRYAGNYSLKATKAGASGTSAKFAITAPIEKGSIFSPSIRYNKPGTQGGTLTMKWGYCKNNMGNTGIIQSQSETLDITIPTTAVAYTLFADEGSNRQRSPEWATHCYLEIDLTNMAAGDIYFDDVVFSQF